LPVVLSGKILLKYGDISKNIATVSGHDNIEGGGLMQSAEGHILEDYLY
jgi:hypothetical protein